jgi:anti-sigma factor RsiW
MTCRQADARLDDHLDDLRPPLERRALALHLGRCAACRRHARTYVDAVELARAAFEAPRPLPELETRAILAALSAGLTH